ncbi:hypothetical protein N44_00160 [Microcystis aeruginosa NIES-44]|uniref:Uncharacterized protein n=1 Tax=Microcystis aeruginosa NIES-44 TaxID=449439 RepID=A0A0A1VPZ7_MICAE|nr:hypothetical protein N44_00160 [Microcystis aeruginosa NIES-44]
MPLAFCLLPFASPHNSPLLNGFSMIADGGPSWFDRSSSVTIRKIVE